ncbi:hypothetical protein, partial [Clostridium estertheticum]|uniref:hypothetical protein n=1 Tax=Clostridium estertheticum TaxID=238834 RepID=UPI001C0BFA0F
KRTKLTFYFVLYFFIIKLIIKPSTSPINAGKKAKNEPIHSNDLVNKNGISIPKRPTNTG